MPTFNYEKAIESGRSDEQILEHLLERHPKFDGNKALKAGRSAQDINKFLSSQETGEPKKQVMDRDFFKREDKDKSYLEMAGERMKTTLKRTASNLSVGQSQHIPGMRITDKEKARSKAESFDYLPSSDTAYELFQGIGPIDKAFKILSNPVSKAAIKMAEKSPYAKGAIEAFGKITGVGLAGSAISSAEDFAHTGQMPSVNKIMDHGITWMAIDFALNMAGKGATFGKAILEKSGVLKESEASILTRISKQLEKENINLEDAEAVTEASFRALEGLEAKEAKTLEGRVTDEAQKIEKIKAGEVETPDFGRTAQEILDESQAQGAESLSKKVEAFEPSFKTSEEAGTRIKESVERTRDAAKAEETKIYDQIEEVAESSVSNPSVSRAAVKKDLADISKLKTKPAGYAGVEKVFNDIVEDLGRGFTNTGKLLELGRRLNEIINYEAIEPHVSKRLTRVKNAVKQDVRNALEKQDPKYLKMFNKVETLHGKNAELFGAESVRSIRKSEFPEKIAQGIGSPTSLKNAKKVLKGNDAKLVERAFLDNLQQASEKKAALMLRESSQYLSREARELAERTVGSKKKVSGPMTDRALDNTVRQELDNLGRAGTEPKRVLDLYKTPKGKKLVDKIISKTNNKSEIKKYLQEKTLENTVEKIVDKGTGEIDRKKMREILTSKNVRIEIANAAGPEGVKMLENLDKAISNIDRNLKLIEKMPFTKQNQLLEKASVGKGKSERMAEAKFGKGKLDRLSDKNKKAVKERVAKEEERIAKEKYAEHPITNRMKDFIKNSGPLGKVLGGFLGLSAFFAHSLTNPLIASGLIYMAETPHFRNALKKAAQKGSGPFHTLRLISIAESLKDDPKKKKKY